MRKLILIFLLGGFIPSLQAAPVLLLIEDAHLRVGPAAHMPAIEVLAVDSELVPLERSGGWYRVRADQMLEGWVPLLSVQVVFRPEMDGAERTGLDRAGLAAALPRPDDAAGLEIYTPTTRELYDFAGAARMTPGTPP